MLDHAQIDWQRVLMDSAYRRPPFQDGATKKGFRDALVVESFMQLINGSPKTPTVCSLVLVTGDKLLTEAVEKRISGMINARVLSNMDELRGFVNTLVSTVDEEFILALQSKADKLFWVSGDESMFFYKEGIREKLQERFKAELAATPAETNRKNGNWTLFPPSFASKKGTRVHWTSRIEIEIEATKYVSAETTGPYSLPSPSLDLSNLYSLPNMSLSLPSGISVSPLSNLGLSGSRYPGGLISSSGARSITTYKGSDAYEIAWSADVTPASELRRASLDEISHVGRTLEPVS
jgi:hypothetical protein